MSVDNNDAPTSNHALNQLYGDMGRTFPTLEQAAAFATGKKYARIYPLWDGLPGLRYRIGYLVSIEAPPPPNRRYSGKVRQE